MSNCLNTKTSRAGLFLRFVSDMLPRPVPGIIFRLVPGFLTALYLFSAAAAAQESIPGMTAAPSDGEVRTVASEYNLRIMAVGDNLMHMGVINTGRMADGSLDYSCLYDGIRPYLDTCDVKIINQETILGGNERGFSGYPHFNSPTEVGDSLAKVGFNVVLHSSNHTADQGIGGMDSCTAFWKTHPEVCMVGLHAPSEPGGYRLLTVRDTTIAILNYAYGPNSGWASNDVRSRMDILCAMDDKGRIDFTHINPKVLEDIAAADSVADIVIVCPHWGNEYELTPTSYQRIFSIQMTEAGADVLIGTHPHVPQPVQWIATENGRISLCYYSLGNYVSTQQRLESMLEGLALVEFHVSDTGVTIVPEKCGVVPLVCHYSTGPMRIKGVYPLEGYTDELAAKHGIRSWGNVNITVPALKELSEKIFGNMILASEAGPLALLSASSNL